MRTQGATINRPYSADSIKNETGERGGVSPSVFSGQLIFHAVKNEVARDQPERASVRFGSQSSLDPDASAFRLME